MATLKLDRSLAGFEDKANEAAQMLKALSNEKRLMILCKLLEHREMSVNALIDQHLARVRARLASLRALEKQLHRLRTA